MPRTEGERDDAGIRFKGEIGSGRTSTRDAFIMRENACSNRVPSVGERRDVPVDPVLRFHRRLDEPIHGRIRGGRLGRQPALRRRVW